MDPQKIETRLQEIRSEIHSLDHIKESNDDVNIHIIEDQIDALIKERNTLMHLLDKHFDDLIGL
jgi:ferritin-like metal-binding protein YciE